MRRTLVNAAVSLASLALFWGVVEGGLRLAGFAPEQAVNPFFDWSKRGELWRFAPGARWRTQVGGHLVSINGHGLRDRDFATLEPGSFRVLVLGDSVTFGHGVANEDSFPRRLERLLAGRSPRVEVLNAGIPGWSTRQQRLFYRDHTAELAPQLVLVAFVLNDFTEMHRGLIDLGAEREAALFRAVTWLARRSAAFAAGKRAFQSARSPGEREIRQTRQLASRADSPEVQRAVDVTLAELEALVALVRERGARVGLVVLPFRFQLVDPSLDSPQRQLARFARERGVPFLDVLPLLAPRGAEAMLMDHDHLTPEGHRAVARSIAEWLDRESLVP